MEYCSLLKDSGILLLGRDNGLFINDSLHLFKGHNIPSITKDFQGNFWISSYGDGAYRLSNDFLQTTTYKNAYTGKICHANMIDNKLYFITEEAKIYKQTRNDAFEQIHEGVKNILFLNPSHKVLSNNLALIITFEKILLFKYLDTHPIIKSFKNVLGNAKEIFADDKNIYFFTPLVTFKISLEALLKGNKILKEEFPERNDYTGGRISSYALDEKGVIWYSTRDSIFSYYNNTLTPRITQNGETFRKMLVRDNYIITYTDNNLLFLYDLKKQTMDSIRIKKAIWENMYFINNSTLLLTTNKEHYLLSLDHKIIRYTDANLVPVKKESIPEQPEYILSGGDNCYFFKESQITRINSAILFKKDRAPKVIFTGFFSDTIPKKLDKAVYLPYRYSKNIRLTFDVLSFTSKDISYQYTISDDSIDRWQPIQSTELNLLVPSYGTYTIKVRAKTVSSDYSVPAVMTLVISRPYWATWWFWTCCTLVSVAIAWLIIQWRTKRVLTKKQQEFETEKRYQQAEYKALNALMNPHFIFNSMNNIQGLINDDEKQTANEYLVIFSEMIRQNMHNIDQGTISLHKELSLCKNYLQLEKLRFKDLINFRFEIEKDIDTEDIYIPPLLIQPLIENAIRHGLLPRQSADSMVTVTITEEGNLLTITVEDNGIGLSMAAKNKSLLHQSVGLSNMRKRMEQIRKINQREMTFTIEEIKNNGEIKGTKAVITIAL